MAPFNPYTKWCENVRDGKRCNKMLIRPTDTYCESCRYDLEQAVAALEWGDNEAATNEP